jgi:hypothetical protein
MPDVDKSPLEISGDSLDQALPSIVDGLNSLQRTILHVHFQRKLVIKNHRACEKGFRDP